LVVKNGLLTVRDGTAILGLSDPDVKLLAMPLFRSALPTLVVVGFARVLMRTEWPAGVGGKSLVG